MEHRTSFLEQAHRNNWRKYLASLRPRVKVGWDLCILTASDEGQAAMYRRQLDWRRQAGLLPTQTCFRVIADPDGRRIGSGGATLRVLRLLADPPPGDPLRERAGPGPAGERALVVHSGGDSRRLPHCSAVGKLFARVPRVLPDGRASTLFDELLISLSGLAAELPPGVLVASGDALLIFDHLQLSFQREGLIGVAAAAPREMGTRHGVYVSGERAHQVRAYLHKPAMETLERWGALDEEGTVQIDTGLVWLSAGLRERLVDLAQTPPVARLCGLDAAPGEEPPAALNLYGDLLLPLAQSSTFEGYLADCSDGPATPVVQEARRAIWARLQGVPFTVERLQPAVFVHFGTSQEYWQLTATDRDLARTCGWTLPAAAWRQDRSEGDDGLALINAVVEEGVTLAREVVLVTDSHLKGPASFQGAALVSGLLTALPLTLRADTVLHQMAVEGGFVTRLFGLRDDPKRTWDEPGSTFMNGPWAAWLDQMGLDPEILWPSLPAGQRTLWNARLYPLHPEREESLRLAVPLQAPAAAPPGWIQRWQACERLSLAEGFARAEGGRIVAEVAEIEDEVAARHFHAAVLQERPARGAAALLGGAGETRTRRARRVGARLEAGDPVVRLRGYQALAKATGDEGWEDRAFATLAEMIEAAVLGPGAIAARGRRAIAGAAVPGGRVRVQAAARIDFGGGWTDTPPYSLERGGTVLNAAITLGGAHPIVCEGDWLPEPTLRLESADLEATLEPAAAGEVLAYRNPADPFALHKAALVLRGIVPGDSDPAIPVADLMRRWGGGLRLRTQTAIPRGSGLGTSSIMAGAVLAALARLLRQEIDLSVWFDEVLCLEQMLSTGGGWQDQVGGLVEGVKLITTPPGLPQRIRIDSTRLARQIVRELADRLVLVYTGQQRLAKDLLRAVMGRWMAREPEMVGLLQEIARLAIAMRDTLQSGEVGAFGALLGEHWALNKRMDPDCTNPFIDELFEVLHPYINGGKLAGAGGGGFVMAIARDREAALELPRALRASYPDVPVDVWPCALPEQALNVEETGLD